MTNTITASPALPGTVFPKPGELRLLDVFVAGPGGGNPVSLVADAAALSMAQMQAIAEHTGHESCFVMPPDDPAADWRLRFFVPQHEMEMCGHATVGALWALRQWGVWTADAARVQTLSGVVDARWDAVAERVWVSQPAVSVEALSREACERVAGVLGLPLDMPLPGMVNASTSRVKTLVLLPDVVALDALRPVFSGMEAVCADIGSTGLYPYALVDGDAVGGPAVAARQFPKASGYPEDAATGIAAAALWGYLAGSNVIAVGPADTPVVCTVRQGEAMGRPSAIAVRARFDAEGCVAGCWISGEVRWKIEGGDRTSETPEGRHGGCRVSLT